MAAKEGSPFAQALMVLGLAVVIGSLILGGGLLFRAVVGWWNSPPAASAIIEEWSSGADTFLMDVPTSCPVQELNYKLWQSDATRPASVEFVVSKMGNQVYTTDRQEFTDYVTSATTLSLPDNSVYALNVRGINARWRFSIACQQK